MRERLQKFTRQGVSASRQSWLWLGMSGLALWLGRDATAPLVISQMWIAADWLARQRSAVLIVNQRENSR